MRTFGTTDIARYTDRYFLNAQRACKGKCPRLMYQVFQRSESMLCGMKYVLPLLHQAHAEVFGLEDGTRISPLEPVLHIAGNAEDLLPLETIYLGLLARMTRVATNVREAVEAANGKPVLFFPARFDVPEVQPYDGYAAFVGRAAGASTAVQAEAFGTPPVGTMPHALIGAFKGSTVMAALALAEACPGEPIWALVDFENDSARTAVEVFKALRERGLNLAGVRLDTSQDLVDEALRSSGRNESRYAGVQPELVWEVRKRLDEAGAKSVKISVSGGFSADKIRLFEERRTPVDVYAIGERFLRGSIPFTSDVVGYFEGDRLVECSKVGRGLRQNPRLKRLV